MLHQQRQGQTLKVHLNWMLKLMIPNIPRGHEWTSYLPNKALWGEEVGNRLRETQGERFSCRGRVFVRSELNTCAKEECSLAFLLVYQLAEEGREGAWKLPECLLQNGVGLFTK